MAGPNDPPANAMKIDPAALRSFAKTLHDESDAIGKLDPGLAAAAGALPGTGWEAACIGAKTSVENSLQRIGSRVTHIADSVEQAGKVIIDTDQQLRDDLNTIGIRV
ncbi:ESX-1 secretion-associated protein [Nocardia spumae]|uniref:ESX-1 secretion-associated protein n=1 Tax=Nocardia spumae TaxID=2887190 RepID=UPI001D15E391|nr:ESX-1 secretion-associated protein [Nocardia spumae]